MLTIDDLLNVKISVQENTWSEIKSEIKLLQVLNYIKNEKLKNKIETLRKELEKGNKDYYDNNKKRLPAVTFSGNFERKRLLSSLKQYIPIIVIDIDKLSEDKLKKVKADLSFCKFVLSFWKSPSNKGYKGLVPLIYNIEKLEEFDIDFIHKCAFRKLAQYFFEKFNIELDKSGSDITRLCFLSSDKELVLKEQLCKFEVKTDDITEVQKSKIYSKQILKFSNSRDALYNPANKNNYRDRRFMSDIIRYLYRTNSTITNNYYDWCKVAMAISNTFTFDIGLKYFKKLSILDKEKYNETICNNFLINCYETRKGEIRFSTIVYLANEQGFKTKYQRIGVLKAEE
ncbi:BT4734/BF3469 family protein [Chryseobacterium sp. JJR-5R]|uniref:BT4734/BF3469 family protein n=1 Tax=Chryseobacterium sp. JJR-5R TaxID=3093923 RepID=UPI002A755C23|nr:BT4734/BF3469 family protein [Chryseobacterium sp. JJR-5R]WPO83839.1 BT4734/BF3469 family protein [Chryseobacterium sp. JJR-5R]